jgi:hypothetical protein
MNKKEKVLHKIVMNTIHNLGAELSDVVDKKNLASKLSSQA